MEGAARSVDRLEERLGTVFDVAQGSSWPAAMAWVRRSSVSHYLGVLASTLQRFDDADRRFAVAADAHLRIGAPTWLARTRLEWARMLLARRHLGDTDRARARLEEALATARELGLASLEEQALGLLPQLER